MFTHTQTHKKQCTHTVLCVNRTSVMIPPDITAAFPKRFNGWKLLSVNSSCEVSGLLCEVRLIETLLSKFSHQCNSVLRLWLVQVRLSHQQMRSRRIKRADDVTVAENPVRGKRSHEQHQCFMILTLNNNSLWKFSSFYSTFHIQLWVHRLLLAFGQLEIFYLCAWTLERDFKILYLTVYKDKVNRKHLTEKQPRNIYDPQALYWYKNNMTMQWCHSADRFIALRTRVCT